MKTVSTLASVVACLLLAAFTSSCSKTPDTATSSVAEGSSADVAAAAEPAGKSCAVVSLIDGQRVSCDKQPSQSAESCQAWADAVTPLGRHVGLLVDRCSVVVAEVAKVEAAPAPAKTEGCACAHFQATECMVWIWGDTKARAWSQGGALGCNQQVCESLVKQFNVGDVCPSPRYLDPLELSNLVPTD